MERNEGSAQRCRSVIEDTLIIFFLNSVMITSFGLGFNDLEVILLTRQKTIKKIGSVGNLYLFIG